jgi:molecular chaperone GrpE
VNYELGIMNEEEKKKRDKSFKGVKSDSDKDTTPKTPKTLITLKPLCESCDEAKAGWQRALADYENLKRDMNDQLSESRDRIKAGFAHDLLPVMDNFDQAVNHAPDLPDHKAWLDGVMFIQKQFEELLKNMGLEKIEVGEEFDPNLHESVGEGKDFKEVASGWKMGDLVIRPAKTITRKECRQRLNIQN